MFKQIVFLCAVVFASAAYAELPMSVEDLITEKGKLKLDLSLSYANSDRQGLSTGEPIVVQVGPTSFLSLPTNIGEARSNSDVLVGTLGLRYGLTRKSEIYGRTNYVYSSYRNSDLSGITSTSENKLADVWGGVNYRFREEDNKPALLGFWEVALYEKHKERNASLKSALLGVTTYKSIDPVVLSLTAAYRANTSRNDGGVDYKPGNMLLINPSIAFAVNDRITLITSLQWTNTYADKIDEQSQGFRRTSTDLALGVGYGFHKGNTVNATLKQNSSGRSGADLRLNWLYTF